MHTNVCRIPFALAAWGWVSLFGFLAMPMHGQIKGPYLIGDAGVNLAQDVSVTSPGVSGTGKLEMEPGFRLDVMGAFYDLNSHLGAGLETGFLYNGVKGSGDWVGHVPFLLSSMFVYPTPDSKWHFYVGGGFGGVVSILASGDTSSDFGFAWQGLAGVRYRISDRASIGIGYKYFGRNEADFEIKGVDLKTGDFQNHAVTLSYSLKF